MANFFYMEENMDKTRENHAGASAQTTEPAGQQLQGSQQSNPQRGQQLQREQQQGHESGALQERRQGGLAHYGRDPFAVMQRLSDEMDQLFESFFHGRPLARSRGQSRLQNLWAPEVEVHDEGNQLRVSVDLPGVSKDNVKVDVREGMLTIEGERREERAEGGEQQGFRRSERRYGSFYRGIPLPEGADAEKAEARMKEGVLEITVPVTPKQTRRLEIQG
jgi:HSP20 family protein